MHNNAHLFKSRDKYYIFDGYSMTAYSLHQRFTSRLNELDRATLNTIAKEIRIDEIPAKHPIINKNYCNRLIINISNDCNLACRYCYANHGDYGVPTINKSMTIETLANGIRSILELFPEGVRFIQFFGGEPMMNKRLLIESIKEINLIFREKAIDPPLYSMVTNGTLLDDEMISFIIKNFCSITFSLDGIKEFNDKNRIYKNGYGSVYEKTEDALRKIKKKSPNFFVACEATINKEHINWYLENNSVSNFYDVMSLGFDAFQVAPVFGCNEKEISLDSVNINDVINYFYDIEKLAVDNIEKNSHKPPSKTLYSLLNNTEIIGNGCGANRNDICMDVLGDLYPCFMFIGNKDYHIGNVNEFRLLECQSKYNKIINMLNIANENPECTDCWAKNICSLSYGHCAGCKQNVNGDVLKPVHLSCEISKKVLELFIARTVDVIERDKHAELL